MTSCLTLVMVFIDQYVQKSWKSFSCCKFEQSPSLPCLPQTSSQAEEMKCEEMLPLDFLSSTFCIDALCWSHNIWLLCSDLCHLTNSWNRLWFFVYIFCIVYFYRFAFDSRMVPPDCTGASKKNKNIFQELVTISGEDGQILNCSFSFGGNKFHF